MEETGSDLDPAFYEGLDDADILAMVDASPDAVSRLERHHVPYMHLFTWEDRAFCCAHRFELAGFCLRCDNFICDDCECKTLEGHTTLSIDEYVQRYESMVPSVGELRERAGWLEEQDRCCSEAIEELRGKVEEAAAYRDIFDSILADEDAVKLQNVQMLDGVRKLVQDCLDNSSALSECIIGGLKELQDLFKYEKEVDGYDDNFNEDFRVLHEERDHLGSKQASYWKRILYYTCMQNEVRVVMHSLESNSMNTLQKAFAVHLHLKGAPAQSDCEIACFSAFNGADILEQCNDVLKMPTDALTRVTECVSLSEPIIMNDLPPMHEEVVANVSTSGILAYTSKLGTKGLYELVLVNLFNHDNRLVIDDVGNRTIPFFYDDNIGLLTLDRRVRVGHCKILMETGDIHTLKDCKHSRLLAGDTAEVSYAQTRRRVYYSVWPHQLYEFDVDSKRGTVVYQNCSGITTMLGIGVPGVRCLANDMMLQLVCLDDEWKPTHLNTQCPHFKVAKCLLVSESDPASLGKGAGFYDGFNFGDPTSASNRLWNPVRPKKFLSIVRIYRDIVLVADMRRDWRFTRIVVK